MSTEEKTEEAIVLIPGQNSPEKIETSIAAFNQPLSNLLEHVGLPTENILSPVEERRKVIYALESCIEILPMEERSKSEYLSKFTVAVSVGLFDGALNFLWDETIKALRELVAKFDFEYFLLVARSINGRYKNITSPDDLEIIGDHDLLEICRRIGFINDINHKRLETVNYLRNHASAAHPNDNSLSGLEMLSLLESCLKYAIMAEPDHSVISIKTLFENLRRQEIPKEDFEHIGQELLKQPQERIDDFALSIFGVYTDERTDAFVRKNIDRLMPHVWDATLDETKFRIGAKFGVFRGNGDVGRKDLVQKFLETVDGLSYKDEDSLAAELLDKLQNLKTVHFEYGNFYNEHYHAKSVSKSIPEAGVPTGVRKLFVKVIVICWVGNGKGYRQGVDEEAVKYYKEFIEAFSLEDIKEFLHAFKDHEFVSDLHRGLPDTRMRGLAKYFKSKTKDTHVNNLLDLIIGFPSGRLPSLSQNGNYKEFIKYV